MLHAPRSRHWLSVAATSPRLIAPWAVINSQAVSPELLRMRHRLRCSQPHTLAGLRWLTTSSLLAQRPLHSLVPPLTVASNYSFKPKTNRYAIVFGLIQALCAVRQWLQVRCHCYHVGHPAGVAALVKLASVTSRWRRSPSASLSVRVGGAPGFGD